MTRWGGIGVVSAALGLAGCTSLLPGDVPNDPDTGNAGMDGGPIEVDGGPIEEDGGPPEEDAGPFSCDGLPDGTECGADTICVGGECIDRVCGNAFVDVELGEECDDANPVPGDGCEPDTCTFSCRTDEGCDDGQVCNGPELCSATHVCEAGTPPPDGDGCFRGAGAGVCRLGICVPPDCGDDIVDPGESCDDGNVDGGDGCEIDCRFTCEVDSKYPLNTYYADCDRDSYSPSVTSAMMQCSMPASGCGGWTLRRPTDNTDTDCDDTDPAFRPGAVETCDMLDNDCDGTPDDGAVAMVYHLDADGDGFGRSTAPLMTCMPPSGYVLDASDCNDNCAACHPGALEICDDLDNDCDAAADEGAGTVYRRDLDDDGFGSNVTMTACTPPGVGWVTTPGDCCDTDDRAYPGATGFHSTARLGACLRNATTAYDFNCDGASTVEVSACGANCEAINSQLTCNLAQAGWRRSPPGGSCTVPACGSPGLYDFGCNWNGTRMVRCADDACPLGACSRPQACR